MIFPVMPKKIPPALVIMVCLLLWAICVQITSALSWGHNSWQLTEWLIDYSGGFVRRGLAGSTLRILSDFTGLQANHLAIAAGVSCYLLLTFWLLRRATKTFPATLILSCIAMGFPAYQDSIVRKDCLGLLFLLGCIKLDDSRLPRLWAMTAINVLAGAAILTHEAFAFYAFPAFVLFARDNEQMSGRVLLRRCLALMPVGACFLIASIYHGSPGIANAVNQGWLPLWRITDPNLPHPEVPAAAIQALGWSAGDGLSPAINLLTSGFYQPLVWVVLFMVSFALVVRFACRDSDLGETQAAETRIRIATMLASQLLFISPLFLLGYDYGRWLFLWVASSMILLTTDRLPPHFMVNLTTCISYRMKPGRIFLRIPASDWYLLLFGIPVCWNVNAFLIANPVMRHLKILWSWR